MEKSWCPGKPRHSKDSAAHLESRPHIRSNTNAHIRHHMNPYIRSHINMHIRSQTHAHIRSHIKVHPQNQIDTHIQNHIKTHQPLEIILRTSSVFPSILVNSVHIYIRRCASGEACLVSNGVSSQALRQHPLPRDKLFGILGPIAKLTSQASRNMWLSYDFIWISYIFCDFHMILYGFDQIAFGFLTI